MNLLLNSNAKIRKMTKRSAFDMVCLGDSNTAISYFSNNQEDRWSHIIGTELNMSVKNLGLDGRRTSDYLLSGQSVADSEKYYFGEYEWRKFTAKYYVICFGLNDVSYYDTSTFEAYTRELIEVIRTEKQGIPILLTNVWLDYPDHYSRDRNTTSIKPYDDIKRNIANDLGIHLIDIYERFKNEYQQNGIWDTRIRTTEIWDDSQDEGKTVESGWYDNIHYNVLGNQIVADEITSYFQTNIL